MEIIKKNNIFITIDSLSISEYIYLINYSHELIKKYEQGLLENILNSLNILIIKYINTPSFDKLINYLKIFFKNTTIIDVNPIITDSYHLCIVIGENYNPNIKNAIYLNKRTISCIAALSLFLLNENNTSPNILDEEIPIEIDKNIIQEIIQKISEKKEYISFLKNNQIENKKIELKEFLFTLIGLTILMIRKL